MYPPLKIGGLWMEFPSGNKEFEEAINLEVVKLPTTALIQLVGSSDLRIIKKRGLN